MPASTLLGRVRDRIIGPPAPPEGPDDWAGRVTAAAAADQDRAVRDYWEAIRAAAADQGPAAAAWAAAQVLGKTADEFRKDAALVKRRFEAHATLTGERAKLAAELAALEAELTADAVEFERVRDAYVAKRKTLAARREEIHARRSEIDSNHHHAFKANPYPWVGAAAAAVGQEIGRLERAAADLVDAIRDAKYQLEVREKDVERNRRQSRNRDDDRFYFEQAERELEGRRAGIADTEARLADVHRRAAELRKRRDEIEAEHFIP